MASSSYDTLLLFAPPGSAKSHYVSVVYPSWWMTRPENEGRHIIAASHSTKLAGKWGRRVRNLIQMHGPTLGAELADDSQAADRWSLATGGEYLAAGVDAGIAGIRADLAVVDDPFSSKKEAYSENARDTVWEWYINDLGPRLKPSAKRVVMHTRWHLDDLAGRIIDQAEVIGQKVRVVSMPAIALKGDVLGRKVGEYLWDDPSGYDYASSLRDRKRELQPVEWAALYQQDPVPEGGSFFKREWLRYYDQLPAGTRCYGASDYATKAGTGDYTVHGVAAVDPEGNFYIVDWWRAQESSDVWIDVLLDMAARWKVLDWAEEAGTIEKSLGPFINKRMRERNIFFNRRPFTSAVDKGSRAQSFRGRLSQGKVYLPRHAEWLKDLVTELLVFPAGKHDDQVDVFSLFGRMVDIMFPARKERPKARTYQSTVPGAGMLG